MRYMKFDILLGVSTLWVTTSLFKKNMNNRTNEGQAAVQSIQFETVSFQSLQFKVTLRSQAALLSTKAILNVSVSPLYEISFYYY